MEVLSHLLNILVENGEDGKMRNLNKIEAKYNVVTECEMSLFECV